MGVLYFLSASCLILFMILATYDGFYLHIFKYKLFNHKESIFEHKMHTIRAALFPLIVWLLFLENSQIALLAGVTLVLIDLVVLGMDAYFEKDSRAFMGGLPKWEYVLHLFANSLHFAAVILIIASRISIDQSRIVINTQIAESLGKDVINFTAVNVIPGAIILALLHVFVLFPFGRQVWNQLRNKIICC